MHGNFTGDMPGVGQEMFGTLTTYESVAEEVLYHRPDDVHAAHCAASFALDEWITASRLIVFSGNPYHQTLYDTYANNDKSRVVLGLTPVNVSTEGVASYEHYFFGHHFTDFEKLSTMAELSVSTTSRIMRNELNDDSTHRLERIARIHQDAYAIGSRLVAGFFIELFPMLNDDGSTKVALCNTLQSNLAISDTAFTIVDSHSDFADELIEIAGLPQDLDAVDRVVAIKDVILCLMMGTMKLREGDGRPPIIASRPLLLAE